MRRAGGAHLQGSPTSFPGRRLPSWYLLGVLLGVLQTSNPTEEDAKGADRRLRAWFLQAVARDVLGTSWRGLHNCCRARISGRSTVDVYRSIKGEGSTFYGGLQRCGSVWICAVCGRKVVEFRRAELARGLARLCGSGGAAAFLTLTLSHGPADVYLELMERVAKALRHLQDSRAWKSLKYEGYIGSIRALEATWGAANGWHPHYHFLLCFACELPEGLEARLWPAWSAALAKVGLSAGRGRGLAVNQTGGAIADYMTKWGVEPSGRTRGPEDELARSAAKSARSAVRFSPLDLLGEFAATGESIYREKFREFACANRGRKQLQWSPGLRALLLADELEKSDGEVVEGIDEVGMLLGRLCVAEWRLVLWAGKRGQLLEAARRAWDDVTGLLEALQRAYDRSLSYAQA